MARIRGAIIVVLMAGDTIGRRADKTIGVTGHALQKPMRTRQWKRGRMDEVTRAPGGSKNAVAPDAVGSKPGSIVVRIGGPMVGLRVAGVAVHWSAHVVRPDGPLVTGVAIDPFVGPDQRQGGGVVVTAHLWPVHPSRGSMAILADRTQPAAMEVLVAIDASRSHMGEHRFLVTVPAPSVFMKSLQNEPGNRMVEISHPTFFIP